MADGVQRSGISKTRSSRLPPTREEMLREVRALATQKGRVLTASDVRQIYTDSNVTSQFGSYDLLFTHAKIFPNKFVPEQLLQMLKEFSESLDHIPTAEDIDRNLSMPGAAVYNRHFGMIEDALKKAKVKPKVVRDRYVDPTPSGQPESAPLPLRVPLQLKPTRPQFDGTLVELLNQLNSRGLNFTDSVDIMLLSGIWELPLEAPHAPANWGAYCRRFRAFGIEMVDHIIRLGVESGAIATATPRYVMLEIFRTFENRINDYTVRVTFSEAPPEPKVVEDFVTDHLIFRRQEEGVQAGSYVVTDVSELFSVGIAIAIVQGEQRRMAAEAAEGESTEGESTGNKPEVTVEAAGGRVFAPEFDPDRVKNLLPETGGLTWVEPDLRPLTTPIADVKVGPLEYPATSPVLPKLEGFSIFDPGDVKWYQTPPSVLIPSSVGLPKFVGEDIFLPDPPLDMIMSGYAVLGGVVAVVGALSVLLPEVELISLSHQGLAPIPATLF